MGGEDIKIGPFIGGLNTFSDPAAAEDTELIELINFECDVDGSLISRPPIVPTGVNMTLGVTGNMKVIGYFITSAGTPFLFGSDGLSTTYYFDGSAWVLVTNTFAASAMCQFRDKAWLVAPETSANPGGTWDPVGGFVAVAAMPKGSCIVANKERLWLAKGKDTTSNGTRFYLTDIVAGNPVWNGNFIDIGPGDGQNIVDLTVYYSDLLVFKQGSTYRFSYDADPSVGIISRVSDNVGVSDINCFAAFENQLYILFDDKVYSFSNYNYDRLNIKVPLRANNPSVVLSEAASVSVWNDRVFVAFFDRTYVYSLKTRTWSEWKSAVLLNIGRIIAPPPNIAGTEFPAYTYSTTPRATMLYTVSDTLSSASEDMVCSFQTKNYDYQTTQRFKRLFGWGLDGLIRTSVTATVLPVSYAVAVTWDQLANYTWDQIAGNTWDRPLDVSLAIADTVTTEGVTGGRKYIQFLKSLRFRQVAFRVVATTNGTVDQSPVHIYNLMSFVKDKEKVSRKIS